MERSQENVEKADEGRGRKRYRAGDRQIIGPLSSGREKRVQSDQTPWGRGEESEQKRRAQADRPGSQPGIARGEPGRRGPRAGRHVCSQGRSGA